MSSIAQCFVPAAAAAVSRDNGIKLAQLPILTLRPDPGTIVSISRLSVQVQMGALSTQLHRIFIKGGHHIRCPLSWQTPSLIVNFPALSALCCFFFAPNFKLIL